MRVRALTWRPAARREPVLTGLNLTIDPGERVLLLGPSGAGKSTLLRALAGLLQAADVGEVSGSVTIDGRAPTDVPGAVALVLQEPGAGLVAATLGRDVAFGLENTRVDPAAMPAAVEDALAAVSLEVPPARATDELSGGQSQRLALAGALALGPRVLLLDEPTSMLDADNARGVREAVAAAVTDRDLTLVVTEHRVEDWVGLVDRAIVLGLGGAIVADGPVADVLANHRNDLLAAGIWVPRAPVPRGPGAVGASGEAPVALAATPLRVSRANRTASGSATALAAELTEPVAVRAGEFLALTGPSGSGKSTLLAALAGFLPADGGRVEVDGRDPAHLSAPELARAIGWVPQWPGGTFVARTVLDEALATTRALGGDVSPASPAHRRASELLTDFGLWPLREADPRTLSGGQARRLALIAALMHGPAVLLADEPTVGQDRLTWAAVAELIDVARAHGSAVVAATHDPDLIARADATLVLEPPARPEPANAAAPLAAGRSPLALLAAMLLAIPTAVASPSWRLNGIALALYVLLGALALAPLDRGWPGRVAGTLGRLVPGALAAASVGWSTWFLAGHDLSAAATVATRVLVIVLPSAVLIRWLDPDALADALAQRMRLPARPVVATAAALRRVQRMRATWDEVRWARRVRGRGSSWRHPAGALAAAGAASFAVLVATLNAAATLAVAMDARGFAGAARRTWFAPAPWSARDTAFLLVAGLPLLVVLAAPR